MNERPIIEMFVASDSILFACLLLSSVISSNTVVCLLVISCHFVIIYNVVFVICLPLSLQALCMSVIMLTDVEVFKQTYNCLSSRVITGVLRHLFDFFGNDSFVY